MAGYGDGGEDVAMSDGDDGNYGSGGGTSSLEACFVCSKLLCVLVQV